MSKLTTTSSFFHNHTDDYLNSRPTSPTGLLLCVAAFLCCILVSIAPLNRLQALVAIQSWPTSRLLLSLGSWLPVDLNLTTKLRDSQISTHLIWLLLLITLEFIMYALASWWIQRQNPASSTRYASAILWSGMLLAGVIFVFTPALLSRDIFVYAGYGRVLARYHANPYFVPLSAYPQDALVPLDDWNTALCAYGPVWLLICGLSSLVAGDHAIVYVFFYRILGFGAHVLNTLLIGAILRTMGKTPRTMTQGTFLYGWNPLVLQESCLGGHNDTLMMTLLLLGLLFALRAERNKLRPLPTVRSYLPPLTAFALATLIKFTSGAFIALFLILLACVLLQAQTYMSVHLSLAALKKLAWGPFVSMILPACFFSIGIVLAFYAPFWVGHSVHDILESFSSPPSAHAAYGSILGAIQNWEKASGGQYEGWGASFIVLLSQHQTWQNISASAVAVTLLVSIVWLWRSPTPQTLILAALTVLGAVLVVTPWFFPWYVIWLVGLAVLCLPTRKERLSRALLGFTLAFSASAYFIYFFRGYQPIGDWVGWIFLTTTGPPLVALLFLFFLPPREL